MQEVTIRKREIFTHYVHIETPGKELCWNFYTRRKNVSFGLFKEVEKPDPSKPVRMVLSTGPGGAAEVVSTTSPTIHSAIRPSVVSSVEPRSSSTSKYKREGKRIEPPGCIPIIPIAHYESSKSTIKGAHFIQEPGTYVLVFDNSFSMSTSKKLFFFVALRDIEPREIVHRKELEGWLLKKGKRTMQGYQRRWVEVHTTGILTYYRLPGGRSHGSVNLMTSAIRLNHDHFLIDIDSDQETFHFKVENESEFERWIGLFEKFTDVLMKAGTSHDQLADRQSEDSDLMRLKNLSTGDSTDSIHKRVSGMTTSLKTELMKLKDLIDASKGRIDTKSQWKDFSLILSGLHDMTSGLVASSTQLEDQLQLLTSELKCQRERNLNTFHSTDTAFQACLADNNKIRNKFGLPSVTADKFRSGDGREESPENRSMVSSIYNRDDVFFDAEEGDESDESSGNYSAHDVLIIDEDSDEASRLSTAQVVNKHHSAVLADSKKNSISSSSASEMSPSNSLPSLSSKPDPVPHQYIGRKELPVPSASMENISIMGILRNNVGKDLSTVAMPIALNEPINILQKLCEELEYCSLLDRASQIDDPAERLAIVAGFVVSGYSSTIHRAARKPFNPLLGETYEFDRPDLGFRYISEKVSHHPPIMASHATSKNYIYYQDSLLRTKFWGKSMELNNVGLVNLKFPLLKEHYIWQKVTTSMRNIFSATRYLEHHGTITIRSKLTGHYCEILFKESGYFSSANNEVVGAVFDSSGNKLMSLGGRWDHSLNKFSDSLPNSLEVLWRAKPFPLNYSENYGFTAFAMELNDLSPNLKNLLPSTDTRFRPDQRLYEQGKHADAEREKLRLEQKQRDFRKRLESDGQQWSPEYFERVSDPNHPSGYAWVYNQKYWEERDSLSPKIDLFS